MAAAPDSLLTAARKLALAAGLEWSYVQRFYRDLQTGRDHREEGSDFEHVRRYLPKSSGRFIWAARPKLVTHLLLAIAGGDPDRACEAVDWTCRLTPGGRKFYLPERPASNVTPPFWAELARRLSIPEAADEVDHIEVRPDMREVILNLHRRQPETYRPAAFDPVLDKAPPPPLPPTPGIFTRGVISGAVLSAVSRNVNFTDRNHMPLRGSRQQTETDPD